MIRSPKHTAAFMERFIKSALRRGAQPHVEDIVGYLCAVENPIPADIREAIAVELEFFAKERRLKVDTVGAPILTIDEILRRKHLLLPNLANYLRSESGPIRKGVRMRIAVVLRRLAKSSSRKRTGLSGGMIRYRLDAVRLYGYRKLELAGQKKAAETARLDTVDKYRTSEGTFARWRRSYGGKVT